MRTNALKTFFILTAIYLAVSCANPVTPSGGPKDTVPPEFIKSEPAMYSRNFTEDQIKITFDEFIQLKNLNEQVIISPPLTVQPEIKLKGKSVVIKLKEKLKENTTYNFFFGNAIVDLTENNPIENFQFIISTGDIIDSLSIEGQVTNAFDLTPAKGVNIGLYTPDNDTVPFDSLPYLVKPYYLTKTDEKGIFSLKNLSDQQYKLFALIDLNSNMVFDQPTESIAFVDSLVSPWFPNKSEPDTSAIDSIELKKPLPQLSAEKKIKLSLFLETDSTQRLMKVVVPKNYLVNIIFKRPVADLKIQPINLDTEINWSIIEYNHTRDTISLWVTDTEKDSLWFVVNDNKTINDTLKVGLQKKVKGKKSATDMEKWKKIDFKSSIKSSSIELNKPLVFSFGYPITKIDTSRILLFENDTIPVYPAISFSDSSSRILSIDYRWKQSMSYRLFIRDSTITNIHHAVNDTIDIEFRSKSVEDYGNLYIQFKPARPGVNHIVQLLSGDKVVLEKQVNSEDRIAFNYLAPGKYNLKVIFDLNDNGLWDTGDYIYKIQPEEVLFFPSEINIRSNWDVEETWELK